MNQKVGLVGFDDSPTWMAQYDPAERWNGWLCPRFDALAVIEVLQWIKVAQAAGEGCITGKFTDAGVLRMTEADDFGAESYDIAPDADGLYALGAYGWCWQALAGERA